MYKEPTCEQIREEHLYREIGLTDGEYERIFELLGRLPNYTETGLFSVMWSEHCSYKTSKPVLRKFPTTGERVLQGPGEGAGIVDIGDNQAVVFKMESHNHPSAIEPYQGAATGVGGIIRDVFSMGARPIALLNSLRFGELNDDRTKYLFANVVAGIAGYGNSIGIPTVGGEVYFNDKYQNNPLVNAMCVGIINHEKIQKGIAKGVGNPVIYIGASTGRDGIHGATFASVELNESSEEKRPAVQVGDPFMEKLLLEATLELLDLGIVEGIQDMGAAGLTSSSSEMASKAGNGIELNLDLVPLRERGMTPYEIMLSESQERMLVVVEKGKEEEVKKVCDKWGIFSNVIGKVTDDNRYRLIFQGEIVADLPVKVLVDEAPVYHKESSVPLYYKLYQENNEIDVPEITNLKEAFLKVLGSPNIASKEYVYQQYDHMVRTSTIVPPGSDAAVILVEGTNKALSLTTDGNGRYVYLDPYIGGAIAVCEAARNIVCSGGEPLAITDNLNFGNPEKKEIFWQLEKAAEGISAACLALNTPVISGNVSLYNETNGEAIYPTPVIGMVGLVHDLKHITTQNFKDEGDIILLFGETYHELTGSELQSVIYHKTEGKAPRIDLEAEKQVQKVTLTLIQQGLIKSAHDVSDGGLVIALAEAVITGNIGAIIDVKTTLRKDAFLFSESQSRILLSVAPENLLEVKSFAEKNNVKVTELGKVQNNNFIIKVNAEKIIDLTLDKITEVWKGAIPWLMKSN